MQLKDKFDTNPLQDFFLSLNDNRDGRKHSGHPSLSNIEPRTSLSINL